MKEVELNYVFDLETVIKKSKKKFLTKKGEEKSIEANYIIESFSEKVGIDAKKIKNSKIKKAETYNSTIKTLNAKKHKRKRVITYFILPEKDKLDIIKQITVTTSRLGLKEVFRDIKIFEKEDLINYGYMDEEGMLNKSNPIVKKLVPKK